MEPQGGVGRWWVLSVPLLVASSTPPFKKKGGITARLARGGRGGRQPLVLCAELSAVGL